MGLARPKQIYPVAPGDRPCDRALRNKLNKFNLRDVKTIQDWVRKLVDTLGRDWIRENFEHRDDFSDALADAHFEEYMARLHLPPVFTVPLILVEMAKINMGDAAYEGATVDRVVRGIVLQEVVRQLITDVYARRKTAV